MNLSLKLILAALLLGFAISFAVRFPESPLRQPPAARADSSSYSPREKSEAEVSVSVFPTQAIPGKPVNFDVGLETHSIELDFDVPAIASLTDDTDADYGTPTWEGSPPGGHHRKGTLTFSRPLVKSAKKLTLTFKNIAGVPARIFSWEVKI